MSAGTLGLGGESDTDQAVLGLELLQSLGGVVDEGEAGGLAATEVGAQAEDLDLLLLGLVQAAELLAELSLGDVGTAGVEDVTNSLKEEHRSVKFSWLELWLNSLAASCDSSSLCLRRKSSSIQSNPIDTRCSILQRKG